MNTFLRADAMRFIARSMVALCFAAQALSAHAAPAVTSLAYTRAMGQLCPPPNCVNPVFEQSHERQSWLLGQLDLGVGLSSGVRPSGFVAAESLTEMASGKLHVGAWAEAAPGAYSYVLADAKLGDTLTLIGADGLPYAGQGASRVELDISGLVAFSSGVDVLAGVAVSVYRPGHFDAFSQGNANDTPYASRAAWLFGPSDTLPDTLALDFVADGAFELLIETFASLSVPGGHSAVFDLSHTVAAQFSGPAGTRFTSASGLFPGSSTADAAVPEPAAAWLMLAALMLMAAPFRRRR